MVAGEELRHPKQLEEIETLREQSRQIADGELLPAIVALMKDQVPDLGQNLFLIGHTFDPWEDAYTFVADYKLVVFVEVSRHGDPTEIKVMSMQEYRQRFSGKLSNRELDAIRVLIQELGASIAIDQNR